MKISTSLLSIWKEVAKIKAIDHSLTDYVHLDVTDGIFVDNMSYYTHIDSFEKKVDIHLMVQNIKEEVDKYMYLNPTYITFQLEAPGAKEDIISYIKQKGSKVGIAISPDTDINMLLPYLPSIDLVLLLSVQPGYGGQPFLEKTVSKIQELCAYKDKYSFVIEVDGGINADTATKCVDADILVVGSFITLSDCYDARILQIKEKFQK